MKLLKFTLCFVYAIIILLLLLVNCNGCNNRMVSVPDNETTVPVDTASIDVPVDSVDVIEEAENVGNNGALKVTLLWNFKGDIDLHILQPNGNEIYWKRKTDAETGGFLDVDNREGGDGAAENIFWVNPMSGTYSISLKYFQPSETEKIKGSGVCSVVIFQEGKEPQTYEVYMSVLNEVKHVDDLVVE